MSSEQLYDEFGNYIGPDLDDVDVVDDGVSSIGSDEDWADDAAHQTHEQHMEDEGKQIITAAEAHAQQQIVLHEDKRYYPSAEEIYGPDAEIVVGEEDTQPIETPIIAPVKTKSFAIVEKNIPDTSWDWKYMAGMMDHPSLIRHVAFIGHLHHGKTSLIDLFVLQSHCVSVPSSKPLHYTATRQDEQERQLSIKAQPISFVLPDLKGKSHLVNVLDTPGHVVFSDEVTAALRAVDAAVLVVDAVEGCMLQTERLLRHAVLQGIPIMVIINKVDRLILELKLPPLDAYHKLAHTIDEINAILEKIGSEQRIRPELNNVCFASALHGWSFTLASFARIYSDYHGNFDPEPFSRKLWGNIYLHHNGSFHNKPERTGDSRTFLHFILEPLWKIYSYVLGTEGQALSDVLVGVGIKLKKEQLQLDSKPLLRLVCSQFFGNTAGLVSMIVQHTPSPINAAEQRVPLIYTGGNDAVSQSMKQCDAKGPLMINICKNYSRADGSAFDNFGRVWSGTVRVGDRVRVLGESYSPDDGEDQSEQEITRIWIFQGRYRVEVSRAIAGNWALFEGIDAAVTKTATVTTSSEACIFRPLSHTGPATMKVAIEPINPSELPKMLDGLRKVDKSYPAAITKVEESGEHVLLGTGELYLDCVLHDLRRMYSDIEIKVADPTTKFAETVIETSSMKCFASTPNTKNTITMIAEPLESGVADDVERGNVRLDAGPQAVASFFQKNYQWDLLSARSIWAFGPDNNGPNLLVDHTLGHQTDKKKLFSIKESIVQGFKWGTREGPLCDEPIRNVKFKVLAAEVADDPSQRARGQLIPTARRVAYSSFLLATPRLMEPVYFVEVLAPADCVSAIYNVLAKRRGHVTASLPKAGTPLYIVHAYIPLIESFGFETDLRTHTQGLAFCLSVFDHWELVPGDPLDRNIVLRPLEPAPLDALAREFMLKTRRRKGLAEDVAVHKYFDDAMLLELAKQDQELSGYFQNL